MGVEPEEIPKRMPHLKLGQIFGTLTYYSDNQDEINQYIEINRIPDELIDLLVGDLWLDYWFVCWYLSNFLWSGIATGFG